MKKSTVFYVSLLVCIASIVLMVLGITNHRAYLSIIGILGLFLSVFLLAGSVSYKKHWKCDKCKEVFPISLWTYFVSTNGRSNQKRLHCPKCDKKTWCRGIDEK